MMTKGGNNRDTFGQGLIPQDILFAEGLAETSQSMNDHQQELKQLLLNPNEEIYHKGNDPIYETFR